MTIFPLFQPRWKQTLRQSVLDRRRPWRLALKRPFTQVRRSPGLAGPRHARVKLRNDPDGSLRRGAVGGFVGFAVAFHVTAVDGLDHHAVPTR